MGYTCRGLCKIATSEGGYKFDRQGGNEDLYGNGAKRCQNCEGAYIGDVCGEWQGNFCPCCECRLRLKPRKKKLKEKILIQTNVRRI